MNFMPRSSSIVRKSLNSVLHKELSSNGADVALADLPNKKDALEQIVKAIKGNGRKAIALTCDVSKEDEVKDMVKKTIDTFGGLDIMVANAGIANQSPILEHELFNRVIDVNLKGTLYCYRAAAIQMIKQGRGGRIIGASSVMGIQSAPTCTAYSVSKFGIRSLTQTAALEWGQYNITVNAYAPGYINTPLTAAAGGGSHGENFLPMLRNCGLKRLGQPEEIAEVVGFLASEGASYVTGGFMFAEIAGWSDRLMNCVKDKL